MNILKIILCTLAFAIIASCGGGGDNVSINSGDMTIDPPPPAGDGNDTFETATPITAGTYTGTISLAPPVRDLDYYRFSLSSRSMITVYTTGETDTEGTLYDEPGTSLAENDNVDSDNDNFRIRITLDAGVYYIKVAGASITTTGDYRLTLGIAAPVSPPPPPPTGDGNDTPATATVITAGTYTGSISEAATVANDGTITDDGDLDWYRFSLPARSSVTVGTAGSTDTIGVLVSSADTETPLYADDDSGSGLNFLINETLDAGTYYITVGGFTTGGYRLTLGTTSIGVLELTVIDGCNDGYNIEYIYFGFRSSPPSGSADVQWPAVGQVYVTNGLNNSSSSHRLSCAGGIKSVCYGAQVRQNGSDTYWGIGIDGDQSCTGCCYSCPASGTNTAGSVTLTCN